MVLTQDMTAIKRYIYYNFLYLLTSNCFSISVISKTLFLDYSPAGPWLVTEAQVSSLIDHFVGNPELNFNFQIYETIYIFLPSARLSLLKLKGRYKFFRGFPQLPF